MANKTDTFRGKSVIELAAKIGLDKKDFEFCSKYSAKLNSETVQRLKNGGKAKLIVVAPTMPVHGTNNQHYIICERFVQAFSLLRKKTLLCVPSFSLEDMLVHETYNNLYPLFDVLSGCRDVSNIAYLHNFITNYINNQLIFDGDASSLPHHLMWSRVASSRDEALKRVITGFGNTKPGRALKEEGFMHMQNSELLALVAASMTEEELKSRIAKIIVGISKDNTAVHLKNLKLEEIVFEMLKSAMNPGLMQNRNGDPVMVYTSPSGNFLPEGNPLAISAAMSLADFVIAKFDSGVPLSIEKFFNITCAENEIKPDMVVVTAFVNELNTYGGATLENAKKKNLAALEKGIQVLIGDIENIKKFGVPVLVSICENRDITKEEIKIIDKYCSDLGVKPVFSSTKKYSAKAGIDFVKSVLEIIRIEKSYFAPLYESALPLKSKINIIAKEIYNKSRVTYSNKAVKELELFERMGYGKLRVSVSRSAYWRETGAENEINIKSASLYAGAGLVMVAAEDGEFMPYYNEKYNLERIKNALQQ